MDKQHSPDEWIERFLNDELTAEQRERFAADLAGDPALRRRLAVHRELDETFAADPDEAQLRATLREVDTAYRTPGAGRWWGAPARRWWSAAAAVLLLVVATLYFIGPWAPTAPRSLAANAFTPYPIDVFRTGDPALAPPADLLSAYQAEEYTAAAAQIARLPEYADSDYWHFYRAVALLGADRAAAAIPLLTDLKRENPLPGLSEAVDWYLALAYLATTEMGEASVLLTQIADSPDHYQRAAARRLLKQL